MRVAILVVVALGVAMLVVVASISVGVAMLVEVVVPEEDGAGVCGRVGIS